MQKEEKKEDTKKWRKYNGDLVRWRKTSWNFYMLGWSSWCHNEQIGLVSKLRLQIKFLHQVLSCNHSLWDILVLFLRSLIHTTPPSLSWSYSKGQYASERRIPHIHGIHIYICGNITMHMTDLLSHSIFSVFESLIYSGKRGLTTLIAL